MMLPAELPMLYMTVTTAFLVEPAVLAINQVTITVYGKSASSSQSLHFLVSSRPLLNLGYLRGLPAKMNPCDVKSRVEMKSTRQLGCGRD
jgi:hypothetical protein